MGLMALAEGLRGRAWLGLVLVLVAFTVVYLPSLEAGFLADDLFQISLFEGMFGDRSVFGLYAFVREDPATTLEHIHRGTLPWWTAPNWRFALLRPLSSLTLAFDHFVFPHRAWLHHLHSLLWGIASLGAVFWALRRVVAKPVALLAVFLLAADTSLGWVVVWLANRCSLVALVFAMLALGLHFRRREMAGAARTERRPEPRQWLWWAELGAWSAAFAGGEYAACGVAYAVAYEVLGARGSWRTRALALAPAMVPMTAFAVVFVVGGYGVLGTATYIDPFAQPLAYLQTLGHRLPRMAAELWLGLPAESPLLGTRLEDVGLRDLVLPRPKTAVGQLPDQGVRHAVFVSLLLVPALVLGHWACRAWLHPDERRVGACAAVGSALAMVPVCAIPPTTRAMLLPAVGVALALALVVTACIRASRSALRERTQPVRRGILVVLTIGIAVVHLGYEVKYAFDTLGGLLRARNSYDRFFDTLAEANLDIEGKHVVIIATPGLITGIHGISMLNVRGEPLPATWQPLSMGQRPHLVRRVDDHTIEMTSVGGAMHRGGEEQLFRPVEIMMRTGERVDAGVFTAEIIHHRADGPDAVRFHFERALGDPSLVLLAVDDDGALQPFEPPIDGRAVVVKPPDLPDLPE